MKVMGEAPTLRSKRLIVTEHGIPYRGRPPGERSRHSSRRSHDLPGSRGKLCTGRRATGELLEPDTATRNAERPKGEKRELESRMPGNSHVRFGGGRSEKYLSRQLAGPLPNVRRVTHDEIADAIG